MSEQESIVIVVDDDQSVRASLDSLLRSVGLDVRSFGSVEDFRRSGRPDLPACLVLDVRMPGLSGLEFQRELIESNNRMSIVFVTGHGDIPMSVQAMKAGAIEFLTKPFRDQDLLDAIQLGLEADRARRKEAGELNVLRQCFASLTPREREVMASVVDGRLNKQIAADLEVSEVTVKVARGQVMRKMQARSLVHLVKMVDRLGLSSAGM